MVQLRGREIEVDGAGRGSPYIQLKDLVESASTRRPTILIWTHADGFTNGMPCVDALIAPV